jgi:hypothetical protein
MIPHSYSTYAHGVSAHIPKEQLISDIESTIKPKNGRAAPESAVPNT